VTSPAQVASPPAKPLMIYDGDCNFCKFWIARWRETTGDRVEYIESQDPRVAGQFPELPRERFETSVQLIEPDGRVYSGAEAVFRALKYGALGSLPSSFYYHMPGARPVTEWCYAFVAQHREFFSTLTRWFWGRQAAKPDYFLVRGIFLRLLGIIYFSAFVSLGAQISGLAGSNGILPAQDFMESARMYVRENGLGWERYHLLPTLCWFNAGDGFLHFLCGAGAVISLVVVAGFAPAPCLSLLWLIYLSLVVVCREFLSFQWDSLLLETGWLAIFLAPLQIFPGRGAQAPPSRLVIWLLRWLLFRLMFESGAVKLLSHDASWSGLTALNFHYETQPLPTWIGWYAHQLPVGFQKFSVLVMFFIELAVPFLIFAPRRLRFFGCCLLLLFQTLILLTGNYCFFNLLTIALCWLLLDDANARALLEKIGRCGRLIGRCVPGVKPPERGAALPIAGPKEAVTPRKTPWGWPPWVTGPLAAVIILITTMQLLGILRGRASWPMPLVALYGWISPFRSVNNYGLFAVMTTTRPEIVVEGSNDGKNWRPYEFKYKPGDPKRPPRFVAPHQPRLDWQMWFAALGTARENRWFIQFCYRLLQGSPEVLELLKNNPFPQSPPRYIRAMLYEYRFSDFRTRRAEGIWWRRELKGEYCPVLSLRPAQ
jgi:predicted DCC family thiol-disulfide oxidoreductase YuxK